MDNLAKEESREKAMIIRMELEKLRTEAYDEEIMKSYRRIAQAIHNHNQTLQQSMT
uniref:Uncharacterized protein n=1 Tax=Onchocerca volvulus TaxID=6282 RepID=A0A8R1TQV2_ONCVO